MSLPGFSRAFVVWQGPAGLFASLAPTFVSVGKFLAVCMLPQEWLVDYIQIDGRQVGAPTDRCRVFIRGVRKKLLDENEVEFGFV
jgi:hypothetical protein